MLHSSTKKLIDRLAEMTELGKLDWTEGDDGNVIYSTEGYSVNLPASADEVVITSIAGKELERAAAADLAISHNEDGTSYADVVAAMTKEATRIALGTETAISTLLAGMEEPAAPDVAAEPELTVEEPEDLVNETTALAEEEPVESESEAPSEEIIEAETKAPEVEAEAETAAEIETEVEAVDEIEADAAETEPEAEDFEAASPVFGADTTEESSGKSDEISAPIAASAVADQDDREGEDTSSEPIETVESAAYDVAPVESESEFTEAVARLADEVNGREESDIDAAAASAVGAVALAAGLSDESEETAEPEPEIAEESILSTEAAEPETVTSIMAAAETSTGVPYVPFGTEEVEPEEAAPVAASPEPDFAIEETPETVEAETAEAGVEEAQIAVEAEADTEPEVDTPETETEPETAEIVRPSFISVASSLSKDSEAPTETPSFGTFSSDPEPEPAPMETVTATSETAETAAPAAETATEVALAQESAPEESPQSYSLSGIGAGFGLGALSAKTEASGIPGPTDGAATEEKIIIDATDDVLPEPEGQSNFSTAPSSSSGISFGTNETSQSGAESNDETEEDTDILKPRTRFNPWD